MNPLKAFTVLSLLLMLIFSCTNELSPDDQSRSNKSVSANTDPVVTDENLTLITTETEGADENAAVETDNPIVQNENSTTTETDQDLENNNDSNSNTNNESEDNNKDKNKDKDKSNNGNHYGWYKK